MKTKTINLYSFDELDDEVKKKAIEKLYDINTNYEWWDCTVGDFKTIGKLIGINIDKVYFSGFSSQGDGACFEGEYQYKKGGLKELLAYAPRDECLHAIARNLQAIQRKRFYQIFASVKHQGRYYHEMCTRISVELQDNSWVNEAIEEDIKNELRSFMQWMYSGLEKEYDYLTSEKSIKETIEANEYTFNDQGEIEN